MNAHAPALRFPTGLFLGLLAGVALALGVLAGWLRSGLREQIVQREAVTLGEVTALQRSLERERLDEAGLDRSDEDYALAALQIARLDGVLGVQLFDTSGRPREDALAPFSLAAPTPDEWALLRAGRPAARYRPGLPDGWSAPADERRARFPVLDVLVPLNAAEDNALTGAARFVVDAGDLRREFAQIDRRLWLQAGAVWAVTALLISAGAWWGFARLRRAHAALEARTRELAQANRELAFATKTSALGALAADLVHGLRNPIAGLEELMRTGADASSWTAGAAAARRMREMVNELVQLLHEDRAGLHYQVPVPELLATVLARVRPHAEPRGVTCRAVAQDPGRALSNRESGIVAAILVNLARNACEAAPIATGSVTLHAEPSGEAWEFRVEDNGPGLPPEVAPAPFEPRRSTKTGGAGIGLALCRQLAGHLGATLTATAAPAGGACFRLNLPPPA